METKFVLSPVVIENFSEKTLKKFLTQNRMNAEFRRSDSEYRDFVEENINNGKLSSYELGKLLFDELLYGEQRSIYMYKLCSYNSEIQEKDTLLEILKKSYGYINSLLKLRT